MFEFGPFLKKLWTKNRNSISFKPVIEKISKFTRMSYLMSTKKNFKNWRKSKIKIFQTVRFGLECLRYLTFKIINSPKEQIYSRLEKQILQFSVTFPVVNLIITYQPSLFLSVVRLLILRLKKQEGILEVKFFLVWTSGIICFWL